MRMQEVIGKLREEAPQLETRMDKVNEHFERASGLCLDLEMATSEEGRKLLLKALAAAMADFGCEFRNLRDSVRAVCAVNARYKEKLGVARKRKNKDSPGQQLLDFGQTSTGVAVGVPADAAPAVSVSVTGQVTGDHTSTRTAQ